MQPLFIGVMFIKTVDSIEEWTEISGSNLPQM